MNMVNVSVMIQYERKYILRHTCEELFGLYNPGGDYTYSTHSKFQYTKQLTKEGITSSHKVT